jgi:hypothetical protein
VHNLAVDPRLLARAASRGIAKLLRQWGLVAAVHTSEPRTPARGDVGRPAQRQARTTYVVGREGTVLNSATQDQQMRVLAQAKGKWRMRSWSMELKWLVMVACALTVPGAGLYDVC